ncbi:MAG: ABC transporter permease [Deltaproteobacteria bacterium]|nr:ABC transporter permease [Deltaproteobacteria bacterium]
MKDFLESLGKKVEDALLTAGRIGIIFGQVCHLAFTPPFKLRNIFRQMEFVGVNSLFIVLLTGSFTGMVLAMQSYIALNKFGAESLVGTTVALSMTRELGPVLTGLMVTGRAGSAMATELGTMRVSEQIDALYTMAINPVKYLIVPRVIAGVLMLPILVIVADLVGIAGGYLIGVNMLDINSGVYMARTEEYLQMSDIFNGLIKAAVFGLLISLSACYQGFNAKGGAEGVGKCTTQAVVMGSVMVLISDFLLTTFMF